MSDTVKEMHVIVSKMVDNLASRFAENKKATLSIDELHNSEIFWNMFLEKVMTRKFSTKSVRSLLERLEKNHPEKNNIINFALSKDVCIRLKYALKTVEISFIQSQA